MQQGSTKPQHQPADGPAFWNITHDFKPGELESDLSKMFFNQALDLHKENEALKQRIKRLEEAGDVMYAKMASVYGPYCFKKVLAARTWTEAKEAP